MNALTLQDRAEAAPAQMGLEGLAPAPAMPHVKLSIVGHLRRHAHFRVSSDGNRVHLIVEVLQAGNGIPFVATYSTSATHRPEIEAMSLRMKPGTAVLLLGRGVDVEDNDGHQALRLVHCDRMVDVNAAEYLTDRQVDQQEA